MGAREVSRNLTRREFIEAAAVGSGALALGATVWTGAGRARAQALPARWDREVDVVVVGTGFAGLAAAIEAHDAGAQVLILEKMPVPGGNSVIAGGVYNCADPGRQVPQGIEDSPEKHLQQTLAGGDYRGDPEKVRFMVEHGLDSLHWLEKMGVGFPKTVFQVYGALYPRSHAPVSPKPAGAGIIAALLDQVERRNIPILMETRVTRIFREGFLSGRVVGVEAERRGRLTSLKARKAVVLAAGGFSANVSMRSKHDPRLGPNIPTTNHAGATGEVLVMAQDVGADVLGMDFIQCVLGAYAQPIKGLLIGGFAPGDLVTSVYVNRNGQRFINEDARRDQITEAAFQQPGQMWFVIEHHGKGGAGDPENVALYGDLEKLPGWKHGNIFRADTLEELAQKAGIPAGNLVETVRKYNAYVERGEDPEFKKAKWNLSRKLDTPPYYASMVTPSVHHTMGGLRVAGTSGRVLDRWGKVIPGLYAAGEITGGTHGTNRLGGNATTDCIVFGRVAGINAAAERV